MCSSDLGKECFEEYAELFEDFLINGWECSYVCDAAPYCGGIHKVPLCRRFSLSCHALTAPQCMITLQKAFKVYSTCSLSVSVQCINRFGRLCCFTHFYTSKNSFSCSIYLQNTKIPHIISGRKSFITSIFQPPVNPR